MNLQDLKNKSLSDWELIELFSCARKHNYVGYFPLIEKSEQKIVMCLSWNILKSIWESIPPKFIYVQSGIFLVNKKDNIVISLNQDQSDIDSNIFLLVQESLPGDYGYAPGLLVTQNEELAKFPEIN